ncbi:MAG: ATP-binding protein [Sulfurimonas sp.]
MLLLFLSIVIILKYKRNKETYNNKNIVLEEKFNQLDNEIKNKEKFLSHASHELRTPMTAIMGLTHLVLENELPKFQREYIQKIDDSAQHLIHIINDILDISKMQAGELTLEKKEFNLNDIFDYILNITSMQVKNNNIDINLQVDKDIPSHIIGDSLRLGQVLINLLANAVKFTKDGEVSLNVKQIDNFGDITSLEFTVADTGIGMNANQLEDIFQSFSQASTATSRKFGGTGLGLSISKQLVEIMGGNIHVKSEEGVGTQFIFTIPFSLKDSKDKRQYRLPSVELLEKKILLVDSINKNVISLIQAFRYFKYTTHSIPSFEEVALGNDFDFDIVIINQNKLTKLAISKLQNFYNKEKKHPKIVILSELHNSLSENILKELTISAYLKTPFTQQSILNVITELYAARSEKSNKSEKINPKDKLKTLHSKKILVAEDNTLNHKIIQGLLKGTGIELTFVENGKEAVYLISKDVKFDLILMDINMPIMNGYEATKQIRKHQKYNSISILAFTADVMKESIQQALKSGMQGHITKPIIIDIFYNKIYDTLQTVSLGNTLETTTSLAKKEEYENLSIQAGLERCKDDKELYIRLLDNFKVMYESSTQKLNNLCIQEQFKEARAMLKKIKDVSLNIGAYNVCESAAAFEYECEKGPRGNSKSFSSTLDDSLTSLFTDIAHFNKTNYSS